MSPTITEFSRQLKKYFEDVRIIEKTAPSKAPDFWLHICRYIVDFAKSPNCSRDLRKKMTLQAEVILTKVKKMKAGEISSVLNSEQAKAPATVPAPAATKSITEQNISEDDMLRALSTQFSLKYLKFTE